MGITTLKFVVQVLCKLYTMKLAVVVLFVTLSLPAFTSALFLGLSGGSAVTIGATSVTATQVALLGLTVVGAKLGFLAGMAIGRALKDARSRGRSSKRYSRRWGKRSVEDEAEDVSMVMNSLMNEIDDGHLDGCFQRLVCEIAAQPTEFEGNSDILKSVELSSGLEMDQRAVSVSKRLNEALQFGADLKKVYIGADYCEQVFNRCFWSGKQMDFLISEYKNAQPNSS